MGYLSVSSSPAYPVSEDRSTSFAVFMSLKVRYHCC